MSDMHVTVAEAAIGGALISALGSAVAGLVIQRSTNSRDHLARLWERKAEVYKALLTEISGWRRRRAEIARRLFNDPSSDDPSPEEISSMVSQVDLTWEGLDEFRVQLTMFGTEQVTRLFTDLSALHGAFAADLISLGKYPFGPPVQSEPEVGPSEAEWKSHLHQSIAFENTKAEAAHRELVERIHTEMEAVPKRSHRFPFNFRTRPKRWTV